ncbi:Metallo-dependent phosphatase [Salix suchowensis]|nr:Metallo-dependent phosphatase [Salix suchowensis]
MEASLSTWPAQEGRFPVVSGFRVSWDSRKPPGQRVLGVWLVNEVDESDHGHASKPGSIHELADGAPVERKKDGRQYKVVTRSIWLKATTDSTFTRPQVLIDDECGQMMSTIVRRYLLGALEYAKWWMASSSYNSGSQFVNKMAQTNDNSVFAQFATSTKSAIAHEQSRREAHYIRKQRGIETPAILLKWRKAASLALHWARSKNHYRAQMNVAMTEHMSGIDPFDGETVRKGECLKQQADEGNSAEDSLLTIRPEVDGRLKDIGRGQ